MPARILLVVASLLLSLFIGITVARRGADAGNPQQHQLTIGLSLDTLKEARWQADRDMFVKRAGELGAQVLVLIALGSRTEIIGLLVVMAASVVWYLLSRALSRRA